MQKDRKIVLFDSISVVDDDEILLQNYFHKIKFLVKE